MALHRWNDIRVQLVAIASRIDRLLAHRAVPNPSDAVDAVSGTWLLCSRIEAVLMRVGTEHRNSLSPPALEQVHKAVAELHTVADTLEALPALLDPARPHGRTWP